MQSRSFSATRPANSAKNANEARKAEISIDKHLFCTLLLLFAMGTVK